LTILATVLARNNKPALAWERLEQSLGRSTWDEIVARSLALPDAGPGLIRDQAELRELDIAIDQTSRIRKSPDVERRLRELFARRSKLQTALDQSINRFVRSQGFPEGPSLPRERIQSSLSADEAFIGWVDLSFERGGPGSVHWAVVLRSRGPSDWVRLDGSGPGGTWTGDDARLSEMLVQEAAHPAGSSDSRIRDLARRLTAQRITPLRKYLDATDDLPAVRHLIVLPSSLMAGIPVELLVDDRIVSYAPSATVFTYLRQRPPPQSRNLLVLGDPIFEQSSTPNTGASLPEYGLLLASVVAGSAADKAAPVKLTSNDVLLTYNGVPLHKIDDLDRAIHEPGLPAIVRVKLWKPDGTVRETDIQAGPLGVVVDRDPAPQAIRRQRQLQASERAAVSPPERRRLPGSRVEAETLSAIFARLGRSVEILTDSDASEQRLELLRQDGTLFHARYIHLGTHGEVNEQKPLQSAVILAQDGLSDPLTQLLEGGRVFDGRLTAQEVLLKWKLDAELVTLSSCQSALGQHEIGEGFLGFAQTFLIVGSRSVCLSLWDADDGGTALLMQRFYTNLLGDRRDLKRPLTKAAALAEAKHWLRTLPRSEALATLATMTNGIVRGTGGKLRPARVSIPETAPKDHENGRPPFAHPYYWAGFVLVGNPD
jgi:hypothetical protein